MSANDSGGRTLIYAIGGRNFDMPGNGLDTVEAFDPVVSTWVRKAPMPTNFHGMAAALGPDGKIYVAGGTNSKIDNSDMVQIYDPKKDRWQSGVTGLRMPYGQECACAVATPEDVLIIGGWPDERKIAVTRAVAFRPTSGKWRELPTLHFATAAAGAVAVPMQESAGHLGYGVYVVGGIPDSRRVQELRLRLSE